MTCEQFPANCLKTNDTRTSKFGEYRNDFTRYLSWAVEKDESSGRKLGDACRQVLVLRFVCRGPKCEARSNSAAVFCSQVPSGSTLRNPSALSLAEMLPKHRLHRIYRRATAPLRPQQPRTPL